MGARNPEKRRQEKALRDDLKARIAETTGLPHSEVSFAVDSIWMDVYDVLRYGKAYRQEIPGYLVFRLQPTKLSRILMDHVRGLEMFLKFKREGVQYYTPEEVDMELAHMLNRIDHIIYTYCHYIKNYKTLQPKSLVYDLARAYKGFKFVFHYLQSVDAKHCLAPLRKAFEVPGHVPAIYMQGVSTPPPAIEYQSFQLPIIPILGVRKVRMRDQGEDAE